MSTRLSRSLTLATLGGAMLLSAAAAIAEVRAVEHPRRGWSVEVVPAEGGRLWTPLVPHEYDQHVLNPGGDVNGDARPSVGVRPVVDRPEAVYAVSTPQGFDLFFAAHGEEGWSTLARIDTDALSDDTDPVLAYDDVGRSMLLWQKTHDLRAVVIAGLSLDGKTWGQEIVEPLGFRPVAMKSDGHEFYFATVNRQSGTIRFRLAAFPFPNGGPALPFPDESLNLLLLEEITTGPDLGGPAAAPQEPSASPRDDSPATLAAITLEMERLGLTVWSSWVTPHSTVEWIAFRGREVLATGTEPFRKGQVDQARDRIRREVEGL